MSVHSRTELLKSLECVAPALSGHEVIPIMTHFWFTGSFVMAYDDRIALRVPMKTDFKGALPGTPLLSLLKASKAREVDITAGDDAVQMKLASSRATLAMLPPDNFVFKMPKLADDEGSPIKRKEWVEAIASLMHSVGHDTSVPEYLGITILPSKDKLELYSSDGNTMSKATLPLGKSGNTFKRRVTLTAEFCTQMLRLEKDAKKTLLALRDDHAIFVADDVTLFGRLIETSRPKNYEDTFSAHVGPDEMAALYDIPTKIDDMIERAIIMTAARHDTHLTRITVKEHSGQFNMLQFYSASGHGDVTDKSQVPNTQGVIECQLDPKLLRKGYPRMDKMLITERCIIMNKGNLFYMISPNN